MKNCKCWLLYIYDIWINSIDSFNQIDLILLKNRIRYSWNVKEKENELKEINLAIKYF